ncbi:MAG TPA: hypothetical protein VLG50_07925 [Candidatus Saccharimonadales bacterium]|nr:hypothetical protein [Candidatus Saccharimonadales bacterium]
MASKQKLKDDVIYKKKQHENELRHLIYQIYEGMTDKNHHPFIKNIKNPKSLLTSLIKLHNMIGLDDIKTSIAKQTTFLINKLNKGDLSMKMLNTVLMSGPGTGKTTVGILMAEIWHHLGFLDLASKNNNQLSLFSKLSHYNEEVLQLYAIMLLFAARLIYHEFLQPMYVKYGNKLIIGMIVLITTVIILLYTNSDALLLTNHNQSIITITSRSDFVDIYLGTTDKKTEKLLRNNIGKVVFIDEAYSLYSGPQDIYGMECLTCINKFMSEHENEIVIIFAGYEEDLKNTIFKAQKGLARRCMWHFKLDDYSIEQLFDIFEQKLKDEHLSILKKDYNKIKDYFVNNKDAFVYAGGDVEKLIFFCQLNQNQCDVVDYKTIKCGIKELYKNNQKLIKNDHDWLQKLKELKNV